MTAKIINGKAIADKMIEGMSDCPPPNVLVVLTVGDDPASQVYVRNKAKACDRAGIPMINPKFPANATDEEIWKRIEKCNRDPNCGSIILQLPIPKHLDEKFLTRSIMSFKDADGFSEENLGKMMKGDESVAPCTPKGIIHLLTETLGTKDFSGKTAVVVGRSNIVGKPLVNMLINHNATTICVHSKTPDIKLFTKQADILVVAVGKPRFIKDDYVKPGAIVIDVGINRDESGKLCGDVDFDKVKEVAGAITPVPGGVGPMTVAHLLDNHINLCSW